MTDGRALTGMRNKGRWETMAGRGRPKGSKNRRKKLQNNTKKYDPDPAEKPAIGTAVFKKPEDQCQNGSPDCCTQ